MTPPVDTECPGFDVNCCAWAKSNPNLILTGSDDRLVKIWDQRSFCCGKPIGGFIGHCEGLTGVDIQ